jgi:gluconate 2-dehydrogenase gamma chain
VRDLPLARREFLADSGRAIAAGWLALELPWLASLAGCARSEAERGAPFTVLTAGEGRTMRAVAAQIIPSDDAMPGAEEAGAVYFVDRALGTAFFASQLPVVRGGLADLDTRARAAGARGGFAELPSARQIDVLRQIEKTPFFAAARTLVVTGTFADPSYGGNRGGAGWKLLGMEHAGSFTAPFGWYDAHADVHGAASGAVA